MIPLVDELKRLAVSCVDIVADNVTYNTLEGLVTTSRYPCASSTSSCIILAASNRPPTLHVCRAATTPTTGLKRNSVIMRFSIAR